MGLSAIALESSPSFPTYPNRIPESEVTAGLALPYAAVALLGRGGAVATLLLVFIAVISSFNSELIAVSSILTYDVYRTYVDPKATGKRLVTISHIAVVSYALAVAAVSVGLYYNGVSMGYLYVLMGVLISAAVLPATLTLLWSGQNKWAAMLSPPIGLVMAIVAWLVTAKKTCGVLDVACTGENDPMLAGNVTALLAPGLLVLVFTLVFGLERYDWKSMMEIRRTDDHDGGGVASGEGDSRFQVEQKTLRRALKMAICITMFLYVLTPLPRRVTSISLPLERATLTTSRTLSLLILWPLPIYGTGYVFSKPFFTGWIVVSFIWIFVSVLLVGVFPAWEGRASVISTAKAVWGRGKDEGVVVEGVSGDGESRTATPEKKGDS